MQSGQLRGLPGGLTDDAPVAHSEPLDFYLVGKARFKSEAEKPGIRVKLKGVYRFWKRLDGKTVGVLAGPKLVATAGRTKRRPHILIRRPTISLRPLRGSWIPVTWFSSIEMRDQTFGNPEAWTRLVLQESLLADTINDLARAVYLRPTATVEGLDRKKYLRWLCSTQGSLLCSTCKETMISRQTLSDEWCQYFGPARDACRACLKDNFGIEEGGY